MPRSAGAVSFFSLLVSGDGKSAVKRQERDFLLRKVGIRAVGKDQCPATLRIRGKKEMKAPQTAGSAAFYFYGMDPAVQNRQIIDLSQTAFSLPVPVIQAALLGYQHLLADKLFRHGSPVDGEQVVFCMKSTMQ